MEPTIFLLYGALVFLATVVASIPFGFVQGFTKAQGKPLSERTLTLLKYPEYATEVLAVVLVLGYLCATHPKESLLHAAAAVLVSSVITFVIEVRTGLMSSKEFSLRLLVGLIVCVPASMVIGSSINAGA